MAAPTQDRPQDSTQDSGPKDVTPCGSSTYDSLKPECPPAVILVGATGRLVRLSVVAVELGLTAGEARGLMGRLGVEIRMLGETPYVMLFALERALWRWFGLSDDLAVFELAWRCYQDLDRRGLMRHLKRLGMKRIAGNLKERALVWENLSKLSKTAHIMERRRGRRRKPTHWVADEMRKAEIPATLGPTLQADPAIRKAAESCYDD